MNKIKNTKSVPVNSLNVGDVILISETPCMVDTVHAERALTGVTYHVLGETLQNLFSKPSLSSITVLL